MTERQTPDPENSDLRELLTKVADGSLAPDEAARQFPNSEPTIRRLVLRLSSAKLVLIGDSTVTGANVEGPHRASRDGDSLVVTTDDDADQGEFGFRFDSTFRRLGRMWNNNNPKKLIIRVNPDLAVDLVVSAGSVDATGLHNGLTFTCDAGSIKAANCSGPLHGRVATGSVNLEWLLESGESRLRCELGSIKVRLHERSSVKVKARAELGTVDLGSQKQLSGGGATGEWTLGEGAGTLDIEVSLGTAKVYGAQG